MSIFSLKKHSSAMDVKALRDNSVQLAAKLAIPLKVVMTFSSRHQLLWNASPRFINSGTLVFAAMLYKASSIGNAMHGFTKCFYAVSNSSSKSPQSSKLQKVYCLQAYKFRGRLFSR
ncbi:hypothetical protein TRVL_08347 [Trypanosoma vivax]|nr:hypothetical protein TRVL_08347 [Trypanosoma vivax]